MKLLLLALVLTTLTFNTVLSAAEYHLLQGQVLHLQSAQQWREVECFGKKWTLRANKATGSEAWIGIDLETKVGEYMITLLNETGETNHETLYVEAADFPQSYITVAKKMADFDQTLLQRIRSDQKILKASYVKTVDANPIIHFSRMPVEGPISTEFGARRHINDTPRSPHSGLDIAASAGDQVYLPLAGSVLVNRSMYLNGNTVVIGHGNGLVSVFCHLQDSNVQEGQWIKTGDLIGHVGSTGRSTGPHLHWSVRYHNARIHPLSILDTPLPAQ
ncbi:MAG: M23 family metallopeptidase [Zetaproteobacteria bacterium]|nr:M23 family metallopeptidase [Zetaproteobacteria bacterium]